MYVNLGCDRIFSMIGKLKTSRRFVCSSSGGYDCVHQGPGSIKQTSLLTMVILHLAAPDTSDTSYLLFMTSGHNRQHGLMQRRFVASKLHFNPPHIAFMMFYRISFYSACKCSEGIYLHFMFRLFVYER